VKKEFILEKSTTIKLPTDQSLLAFHDAVNKALNELQFSNQSLPVSVICGSALQMMFNFPYHWMGKSASEPGVFVATIADQAQAFFASKQNAGADLG
jgi:hypothetical protein